MDSQLIIFIIFFLILVSMTLLIMAFAKPKQKEDITIRLEKLRNLQINEAEQAKKRDERYDKIKKEYKQFSRRINPFAQRLLNPKTEEQLKTKFIKAGNYDQESITFITNRIISGLAFAFFILLFNFINKNMNMANTVMLAEVFAKIGDFDGAIEYMDECIKIDKELNLSTLKSDIKYKEQLIAKKNKKESAEPAKTISNKKPEDLNNQESKELEKEPVSDKKRGWFWGKK